MGLAWGSIELLDLHRPARASRHLPALLQERLSRCWLCSAAGCLLAAHETVVHLGRDGRPGHGRAGAPSNEAVASGCSGML